MTGFDSLIGAPVELSAPDGRVFCFSVRFLAPYAGKTYAVLAQDADGQLLITTVEPMPDGQVAFTVVGDEDILSAVLEKMTAHAVMREMASCDLQDAEPPEASCGCASEPPR